MSPTVPPSSMMHASGVSHSHQRDGQRRLDPILDRVGDVGNDLNRLAEVVAASFGFNDFGVDFARGQVVVF